MAAFLRLPTLHIGDKYQWETEGQLIYESDLCVPLIVVPDGFKTDLASIPRWVPELLVQRNGRHRKAAIVHDFMCRTWMLDARPLADRIFLEAMAVDGVPRWRRYIMYAAVRAMTAFLLLKEGLKNE